jgi:hypothetical protein
MLIVHCRVGLRGYLLVPDVGRSGCRAPNPDDGNRTRKGIRVNTAVYESVRTRRPGTSSTSAGRFTRNSRHGQQGWGALDRPHV